ncbi:MAG: GNAT family N-acetyltransferase [Saprospiraceae bacterium]|nr:GNAT family N-acetyltransferase [Saprospiraceae bacterium]
MIFRQGKKEDIKTVVGLGRDFCPKEYISHSEIIEAFASEPLKWNPQWWLRFESFLYSHFEENPEWLHVIEHKETKEVVGYAILQIDQEFDYAQKYGTVHDILVHPDFAGKGLGSDFFKYIENYLLSEGCEFLLFESGSENHNAHHFFEKHQYKVISKVFYKPLK